MQTLATSLHDHLLDGVVIPAHPLALTPDQRLDEDAQAALTRYYYAAGAGGVAVGVHTTQFEIHDSDHALYKPVLQLAADVVDAAQAASPRPFLKVAGLIGDTTQALHEAQLAVDLGYHAGLLSLAAFKNSSDEALLAHCRQIAACIPLFGFYLQPSVGGRPLSYRFWRQFAEIENVIAIKIAPFNRYQTLDVVRAVADAGRAADIALYTGNDDNIVADLLTDYSFCQDQPPLRIVGGLLGQWAAWTHAAVTMLNEIKQERAEDRLRYGHWLTYGAQLTDANSAIFDADNDYCGCIPGISYVLARQGLVQGPWSLNPNEVLSPGQVEEIERVYTQYPILHDDDFVNERKDAWFA